MGRPKIARWSELLSEQVVRISGVSGKKKKWLVGHLLAGIGLVAACAHFSSWIHVQNITLNYRLSERHRLQQELNWSRDSLEIERQMLRSPQRITRIAENELGMHLPAAGERVVLR